MRERKSITLINAVQTLPTKMTPTRPAASMAEKDNMDACNDHYCPPFSVSLFPPHFLSPCSLLFLQQIMEWVLWHRTKSKILLLGRNNSGYIFINPVTFENSIFISNRSPSTIAFLSIFQKFLVHTYMPENAKIILLHMRKKS